MLACENVGTICQEPTRCALVVYYSTHHPLDLTKKIVACHPYVAFKLLADNQNKAQSSPPPASFDCYNMKCYCKFPMERGLHAHLWHSNSGNKYKSSKCPYALRQEVVADES